MSQDTFLFDATDPRQHPCRIPRGNRRRDRDRGPCRRAARLRHGASPRLRHPRRGARRSPFGGSTAATLDRRALLRNPTVLILDEATSALDPRTERLIAATLDRVSEGRTTIAVTHRLTSVADYDRIFVVSRAGSSSRAPTTSWSRSEVSTRRCSPSRPAGRCLRKRPSMPRPALVRIPLFAPLPARTRSTPSRRDSVSRPRGRRGDHRGRRAARDRPPAAAPAHHRPRRRAGTGRRARPGRLLRSHRVAGARTRGAEPVASERTRLLVLDDETLSSLAAYLPTGRGRTAGHRRADGGAGRRHPPLAPDHRSPRTFDAAGARVAVHRATVRRHRARRRAPSSPLTSFRSRDAARRTGTQRLLRPQCSESGCVPPILRFHTTRCSCPSPWAARPIVLRWYRRSAPSSCSNSSTTGSCTTDRRATAGRWGRGSRAT